MKITTFLKNNIVYLDGGMGSLLQASGLKAGEFPERWNITNKSVITDIHKSYFDSGSNVINTNTFGANILKFSYTELENIIKYAVKNAKNARKLSTGNQPKFIALDIGPTGKMLKPYGDLDFEDAVNVFKTTVTLGVKYGVDLVFIETMNDLYETKAALLAVKEVCNLPVFVSNAYGEDGRLTTGANAESVIATLEGLGATAIGVNCSLGPKQLAPIINDYLKYSSLPIILKPNAGLPKIENGKTVYDVLEEEFATDVSALIEKGVSLAGGCCGTTPKYIKALIDKSKNLKRKKTTQKNYTVISSYTHAVNFDNAPILIGERINPTGKKRFKQALIEGDIDYILNEAVTQQEKGVHVLDVNVGLPEIDEVLTIEKAVTEIQAVVNLPLQIDTSNVTAMERALRLYNGKALINSVNGKKESMNAVFPLVKKYGGVVVALTLDENGIPNDANARVDIAVKILNEAKKYNIDKNNIIFDPLALTISADKNSALVTLQAVKIITEKLKCKTVLGVSNVSFGLPSRDIINANFLTLALNNGLTSAIINPNSVEMLKAYNAYKALLGKDENFTNYITFASNLTEKVIENKPVIENVDGKFTSLQTAIIKGFKEKAGEITAELLKTCNPLDIIKNEIIPALDEVGVGFENKKIYLPNLLMSAESAKTAFSYIKNAMSEQNSTKSVFVIATVKGDIHDIGKNIVKLLLENYGYKVIDLGRDVAPETIVKAVISNNAPLCGLSALMTTTTPAMQETIKLLKVKAPWCKTVVGGAVLTEEFAKSIGADKYCKDAMETVRYAESITNN